MNPNIFFTNSKKRNELEVQRAIAICDSCSVKETFCKQEVLSRSIAQIDGVMAGRTEDEQKKLIRRNRRLQDQLASVS